MNIQQEINKINEALKTYQFGNKPKELYDPISYVLQLGGKRFRPLLTLFAYSLYKNDIEQALKPALGVEVFHNFTLLHDDIMDKAPLRRGQATVHNKWNENVAILSGDTMLIKAYELLLQSPDRHLRFVIRNFNKTAVEVCEGQQLDMNFETSNTVSEEAYIEMIRLKTAVLLGFSLQLGAIMADAPEKDIESLYNFGSTIGIGFQLKDDLLDVYGDPEAFGKQVGGDIISNKKTYLLINALNLANDEERKELDYWLALENFDHKEKVNAVTSVYNQLAIKERTEQLMNHYFDKGLSYLDHLSCHEDRKKALLEFSHNLIKRDK